MGNKGKESSWKKEQLKKIAEVGKDKTIQETY